MTYTCLFYTAKTPSCGAQCRGLDSSIISRVEVPLPRSGLPWQGCGLTLGIWANRNVSVHLLWKHWLKEVTRAWPGEKKFLFSVSHSIVFALTLSAFLRSPSKHLNWPKTLLLPPNSDNIGDWVLSCKVSHCLWSSAYLEKYVTEKKKLLKILGLKQHSDTVAAYLLAVIFHGCSTAGFLPCIFWLPLTDEACWMQFAMDHSASVCYYSWHPMVLSNSFLVTYLLQ